MDTSTTATHSISVHPDLYHETMNALYSYIANSEHGYLTQEELFHHYRQQHENTEIPYLFLGYSSLLHLPSSDQGIFTIYFHREIAYIYLTNKVNFSKNKNIRRSFEQFSFSIHHDMIYMHLIHILNGMKVCQEFLKIKFISLIDLSTRPSSNSSMPYGAEGAVGGLTPIYPQTSHFNPQTCQGAPRMRKIAFKNKIDFFE